MHFIILASFHSLASGFQATVNQI